MRKLPHAAAEDLLEVIMPRYERASTIMTSNRPVGKLLGDNAAVSAARSLLHHAHVLKCGPLAKQIACVIIRGECTPQTRNVCAGQVAARRHGPSSWWL